MTLKEKTFLNVEELCEYLNASLSTVYKLAQNGEIPAQKLGRQWRFSREKIDEWVAVGRTAPTVCGLSSTGAKDSAKSGGVAGKGANASNDARPNGPDLTEVFSEEQMKTLRAFSLDSAPRLLTTLATATGRKGLEALLGLSCDELDAIATKIVSQM